MQWLDDQPPLSVVFLCFGSMGSFGADQVKEIALGLEGSGHRFLWSLQTPTPTPFADDVLPEGFLDRIKGKGMICNGWAAQVEVLAHKVIGGFVSHCGWNSILESLCHGIPIVTWPIYAEQQLNAYRIVRELGLAVELSLDYRNGADLVMADAIDRAVRRVMDDNEIRKKVKEMGEMAKKAVMDGGSSFNSIGKLIEDMIGQRLTWTMHGIKDYLAWVILILDVISLNLLKCACFYFTLWLKFLFCSNKCLKTLLHGAQTFSIWVLCFFLYTL